MKPSESEQAFVHLNSWAGRTKHSVTILKETPKRYYVRWDDQTSFLGRFETGCYYYIPKYAITKGSNEREVTEPSLPHSLGKDSYQHEDKEWER
jgi:hypothetical protein